MAPTPMALLREQFPRRAVLNVAEVAELYGTNPTYIRTSIRTGVWPIPHQRIGRKIVFRIIDVARALEGDFRTPQITTPKKSKVGRPQKAKRIVRR